jgi:hypothetical protein
LLIAKFKIKLIRPEKIKFEKKSKINIEILKDPGVKKQYQMAIDNAIKEINENNEELRLGSNSRRS